MSKFTYFKKKKLIDKKTINNLRDRFDYIYQKNIYKTLSNQIYVLKKKDLLNEPLFTSLFNLLKKEYELISGKYDLSLAQLQLHHTVAKNTDYTKLPYIPHIDKSRYLKAMIYLHDVTLDHGPINLGNIKQGVDIEKIRKKLPKNYKESGLNSISHKDIEGDMKALEGNAGDVIFFDTNTPHHAGIITKGYSRKILRFDFERPFFNSIKSYILNRYFY